MKKDKILKLIVISLIVILIYFFVNSSVLAATNGFSAAGLTGKKATTTFDDKAKEETNFSKLATNSAKTAVIIMRIAGITIAVVMLLVVSIKYMVSSAGDRADIKKHAIVYVIGALVLFGAVGILGIIENFSTKALGV